MQLAVQGHQQPVNPASSYQHVAYELKLARLHCKQPCLENTSSEKNANVMPVAQGKQV